ncbi:MAG TPA: redoxin family protein [Planctomycetota bacterium]|nr:redoxin family protein [Planctomycetota bacterium]
MRRLLALVGVAALCASAWTAEAANEARALDPAEARIGETIPDLAFVDLDGRVGRLSDHADAAALVIACFGADCPISRKYLPRLVELRQRFRERAVAFLVVACAGDDQDTVRAALAGSDLRAVDDRDLALATALGARTTTDAFVVDAGRRLLYRGAIDDRHGLTYDREERAREFLIDALDAVLAGEPIALPATSAPGCEIAFAATPTAIPELTWSRQIGRIFQRSCQQCHRDEGGGPFELLTYEQVRRKRAVIRRVVATRAMPPWSADHAVGGPWSNDRRLPDADHRAVLAWLAADCPQGDPAEEPPPRAWAGEWEIGAPDAIVQLATPIEVPATGTMDYQYIDVATDFPEDRWVQAVEMRPTAPEVVHHAQTFLLLDGAKLFENRRPGSDGRLNCYFSAMVPGDRCQIYPPGVARFLPKGATLQFEIHYVPNGTATSDRMRVGLIFADRKPEFEVQSFDITNDRIRIPPGDPDYVISARYTMPVPARLLAFQPHMHLRGKSFTFDLTLPDGTARPLLSIPSWDFRWQTSYRMAVPLDVPAGSTITVTGRYDNSAANPANPDPTAVVRAGAHTTDEMLVGFGEWHPLPADAPADRP